jgi:dTDP-glucose 4,6-dehydratase
MSESMTQSVLVTGGAGFIGSNFVRHLLAKTDFAVVVLDKLTYAGNRASLAELDGRSRFRLLVGDICDRELLDRLFADLRLRWVVNFAAESHVDRSIDGPRAFVTTNVVGTFELLDAARRHLVARSPEDQESFRLLHVSTDEVYGSLGPTGAFQEDTPYAPNSPYAATKAGADHLVRAYRETYGLPLLLTNCSNNYGPFQYPEKLIPLTLLNAIEGKPLPIYGDGRNVRDWLFVEDHCAALLAVLERGAPGEKYNIGGGCQRTNLEVVDAICATLERLMPAVRNQAMCRLRRTSYSSLKTFVPDRPGHDRRYAIDSTKICRDVGWQAKYDFAAGLEATVRWYMHQQPWCEAVQRDTYGRERLGLTAHSSRSST